MAEAETARKATVSPEMNRTSDGSVKNLPALGAGKAGKLAPLGRPSPLSRDTSDADKLAK